MVSCCTAKCSENPECFENICLEAGYCRDIRPAREISEAIVVDMKYEIDDVISVDTELNVVGVQVSLTQTWMDNRVNTSKNVQRRVEQGEWISAPGRMYKQDETMPEIWTPTLWIYSMTNFEVKRTYEDQSYLAVEKPIHDSNRSSELLKRHSKSPKQDGYFLHYFTQFDVYVKCDMDYNYFPFDTHICHFEMTSVDLNANILKFKTTPTPDWHYGKKLNTQYKTRYFNSEIHPLEEKNRTYSNSPWSITGFKLQLTTRRSEYVYNYMFPSALCVIVSWITFVLPLEDVNARVAILITMLLVLVTVFNSVLEKTPRAADGTTAIICWMLLMLTFVFAAFIAYSASLIFKKKKQIVNARKMSEKPKDEIGTDTKKAGDVNDKETTGRKYFRKHKSDMIILCVLITSFLAFVFVFYLVYIL
jgi:hypothetical protein